MRIYKGKNILITGGSKGIGKSVAMELASRGANIYLVARDKQILNTTRIEILSKFPTIRCGISSADVSDPTQVKNSIDEMLHGFGQIDGLINNAGFAVAQYFEKIPTQTFARSIAVNYLGSVYFAKEVVPYLKKGSFVSFTSSVAGYLGVFGLTNYVGPKFAIIGFAEALRQELAPREIQISVLCPPDTFTPGLEKERKQGRPFETEYLNSNAQIMEPGEVAVKFLDSLAKGKFLITVNTESALFYRLNGITPGLTRQIMSWMVSKAQKKHSGDKSLV